MPALTSVTSTLIFALQNSSYTTWREKKDPFGQQHFLSKPVQEGLEPVTTSRVPIDAPMLIGFLSWSSKELIKSWCKVSAEPGEHFAYGTRQTGGWWVPM